MNKALLIITGLLIGIGGEWFIPDKYGYPISMGCIKSNDVIWYPMLAVYDSKTDKYPIGFGSQYRVTSYQSLYDHISGRVSILKTEDCNKITELYIKGEMEYYSQFFKRKLK